MRIAFGLVVFLAACGNDADMLPVGGGSGNGLPDSGTGSTVDARLIDARVIDAAPAPVDAAIFSGRVCLLTDPRQLNVCASAGAGGLTVRLGTASATTSADGSFMIAGQTGSDLIWRVTGSNIKSSFEVLRDYQIPAMTKTMYDSIAAANGVVADPGEGDLMIEVTHNGVGQAGVTVATTPPGYFGVFYDGASATAWTTSSTGANGAIWVPGIDVGTGSVTATLSTSQTVTGPIRDDGITFANVIVP
jgi:hypothetical protein